MTNSGLKMTAVMAAMTSHTLRNGRPLRTKAQKVAPKTLARKVRVMRTRLARVSRLNRTGWKAPGFGGGNGRDLENTVDRERV